MKAEKLSPAALSAGYSVEKEIYGYAYARSGNAHNPTPRVWWHTKREGKTVGTSGRRGDAVQFANDIVAGVYK